MPYIYRLGHSPSKGWNDAWGEGEWAARGSPGADLCQYLTGLPTAAAPRLPPGPRPRLRPPLASAASPHWEVAIATREIPANLNEEKKPYSIWRPTADEKKLCFFFFFLNASCTQSQFYSCTNMNHFILVVTIKSFTIAVLLMFVELIWIHSISVIIPTSD